MMILQKDGLEYTDTSQGIAHVSPTYNLVSPRESLLTRLPLAISLALLPGVWKLNLETDTMPRSTHPAGRTVLL